MKVLITGGAGFIGSHLAESFAGEAEIRILDNLRSGHLHNLNGIEHTFIEGSITDRSQVRQAMEGVDLVFHLAAMVSVPESVKHPEECEAINTTGTRIVLEEAARTGVRKCCFSSTSAIYGNNPVVPKQEDMSPEPMSPYAATKREGERLCEHFQREGRLHTACLRYFNVFGPRQDPGSAYAAAIPIFLHRALQGEDLTIYGDGEQTRDFIYVRDVVSANRFIAAHPEHSGIYNVGTGHSIRILDLAERIIALTKSSSQIHFEPPRPGDVLHSTACIDRLQQTGWPPAHGFEKGLTDTIAFFQQTDS